MRIAYYVAMLTNALHQEPSTFDQMHRIYGIYGTYVREELCYKILYKI